MKTSLAINGLGHVVKMSGFEIVCFGVSYLVQMLFKTVFWVADCWRYNSFPLKWFDVLFKSERRFLSLGPAFP